MSATLASNGASACLLLALMLASYLDFCDGSLTGRVDENATLPETTIPQGSIRGINMVTHHNRTVFGFIGIPYAQPPVGDLRFRAPLPPAGWNGTFDANKDTTPCPQLDNLVFTGEEDCLYLNVFTPKLPESDNSTLLPVMVYLIGGAFRGGVNALDRYGPDMLLDKDVLLVIPNSRSGVLGYLTTGDEVSPGNYGLKDIVRVLEWVHDSIQYFGGDPNQVTLAGGSSGAMSVHLLASSNLTNGLIHKYITQSGTASAVTVNQPREVCVDRATQLGEYLGCPTNTSTLLVNCLRGFNASQLVDTRSVFFVWGTYPDNVWLPTTEPDLEGALLTDIPANLYAAGKVPDLPWLASLTRDEGFIPKLTEDADTFDDLLVNIDLALPEILGYRDIVDDVTAYTTALKSYYLNDLSANRSLLQNNMTDLLGDAQFIYPTYSALKQQLTLAKNPQYFCSLEYTGTFSHTYFYNEGQTEYTGVSHGDEIIYLFGHHNRYGPPDVEFNEADLLMVDTMVSLWTSFMINGTPTVDDSISTATWEPFSSLNNYLRIGNGTDTALEMKNDFLSERMQFWDKLTAATTTTTTSGEVRNHVHIMSIVSLCLCLLSYTL